MCVVVIDHNVTGQVIREDINPPVDVFFLVPLSAEKIIMIDGLVQHLNIGNHYPQISIPV